MTVPSLVAVFALALVVVSVPALVAGILLLFSIVILGLLSLVHLLHGETSVHALIAVRASASGFEFAVTSIAAVFSAAAVSGL